MILSCSLDPRLFQLCRAPGVGLSSPMCTRFLIDSDGVHKRDDTRDVDSKQSDDGIDHTFVSAGGRWDDLFSFRALSLLMFIMLSILHCKTDTKVQWTRTYGVAHPSLGVDVGSRCRGVR